MSCRSGGLFRAFHTVINKKKSKHVEDRETVINCRQCVRYLKKGIIKCALRTVKYKTKRSCMIIYFGINNLNTTKR